MDENITISEPERLDELVVYKGAKVSEYRNLLKAPNFVNGDSRSGDFYGLMAVDSPERAAGASISQVSYYHGVADDSADPGRRECGLPPDPNAPADPEPEDPLIPPPFPQPGQPSFPLGPPKPHCLPDESGNVVYHKVPEAGGIVKYIVPGPVDLVTVKYKAGVSLTEIASAVSKKHDIAEEKNLVAELGRNGKNVALKLLGENSNGSERQQIIIPWGIAEDRPTRTESFAEFGGVHNYEANTPGASPSWTEARAIQRGLECRDQSTPFCELSAKELTEAVDKAKVTAEAVVKDPGFEVPKPAPGEVLSEQQIREIADKLVPKIEARTGRAMFPGASRSSISVAVAGIVTHAHDAVLASRAVGVAADKDETALNKATAALAPIPVLGDVAGFVNGAAEGDGVEMVQSLVTLGLSVVALAFPPLAPVAGVAIVAIDVAVALGRYLYGYLFVTPPDPREDAYQQNQALLEAHGVRPQWEHAKYGLVMAHPQGQLSYQSLILEAKDDVGFGLGGFSGVGHSELDLKVHAVRVFQDGIRSTDLACRQQWVGGQVHCVAPVPLLASQDHPLRIEFVYEGASSCENGDLCRTKDVTVDLVTTDNQTLPLKYAMST